MRNSLSRHLAVIFAPQNSIFRLRQRTPFLDVELGVFHYATILFFTNIVCVLIELSFYLTQANPPYRDLVGALFLLTGLTVPCLLGVLYKLYNRRITRNQFLWCSEVHTYMGLPAPTVDMRRLELALYDYRFQDLDESIRDRYNPFKYE